MPLPSRWHRGPALAALLLLGAWCAPAHATGPDWHTDFPTARAAAAAEGTLLVLDLWAPWCHTCLSMQQTVLTPARLAPLAARFTFVALDTDRPEHAAIVARYPPPVWPTFYVIDPTSGDVRGRWLGAADFARFEGFLNEAAAAAPPHSPAALTRRADALAAAGRLAEAESVYAQALAAAPPGWRRRADVRTSQISLRRRLGDHAECLALGQQALPEAVAGHTASAADFVYGLWACATALPAHPDSRRALRAAAVALAEVLADDDAPLTVDDRGEALRMARAVWLALGDVDEATALAETQRALLADAWATADAPRRMTLGWPRAEVHHFLKQEAALVPDLVALVAALPDAYDPPYRLAWVLLKADRPSEALAPAAAAAARAYGPRRIRALQLLADVQVAAGRYADARATAAEGLQALLRLNPSERPAGAAAALGATEHRALSALGPQ